MSVHITIRSNLRAFEREIKRIEDMPDARTVRLLNAVLAQGFTEVKGSIHVQTGALKSSAQKSSDVNDSADTWRGTISVGNEGAVDYAIYEKVRETDEHGDHDFFRGLPALDPLFIEAILKGLNG